MIKLEHGLINIQRDRIFYLIVICIMTFSHTYMICMFFVEGFIIYHDMLP